MEALKTVWNFIEEEVLGMSWLNRLTEAFFGCVRYRFHRQAGRQHPVFSL